MGRSSGTLRPAGWGGPALGVAALVLLGALAIWLVTEPGARPGVRATLSLADALGDPDEPAGFARALGPRPFAFPADHGPHPGYRTEWWYWTGNLLAGDGRHLGFQLTFFRIALRPAPVPRVSAWGATEIAMAHFAVTDTARGRFHAADRLSRAALDLAGARAAPFRVWVEDWVAEGTGPGPETFPLRLRAREGEVAIDLVAEAGKPPVLQGDRGWSRKSEAPGNASYYYSLTRMPTRGVVTLGAEALSVRGLAWMDREWSTSALGAEQVGWDWFALQLDDGRDLMLYRLRRRDGGLDPVSEGTLVERDGAARRLGRDDVAVEALAWWDSPRGGARYPARWRLRVPAAGIDLDVEPVVADQELNLAVRYWEGAVRFRGMSGGVPVAGRGYVELTGYAR